MKTLTTIRGHILDKLVNSTQVAHGSVPCDSNESKLLAHCSGDAKLSSIGPNYLAEVFVRGSGWLGLSLVKVIVFYFIVPALNHLSAHDAIADHCSLAFWTWWGEVGQIFPCGKNNNQENSYSELLTFAIFPNFALVSHLTMHITVLRVVFTFNSSKFNIRGFCICRRLVIGHEVQILPGWYDLLSIFF